jgi:hypothetical protein
MMTKPTSEGSVARIDVAADAGQRKWGGRMSRRGLGVAFWVKAVLSGFGTFLGLLTIVWHDWIESVFGVDPDHGNGSAEWVAVVVLLVIGAGTGALARREWRRAHALLA